jgi:hypothetical protein
MARGCQPGGGCGAEHTGADVARPGQPTKFTAAVRAKILKALRDGTPPRYAAAAARVHYATYLRWLADGRKADAAPEFREFCEAVMEARAAGAAEMIAAIRKHGRKDWRALQYVLACFDPGEFSTDKRRFAELERKVAELEKARGAAGGP